MTWEVMDFARGSGCPVRTYESWRHSVTAMTTTPTTTTPRIEDRLRNILQVDAAVTGAAGVFALVGPTSAYGDLPGWLPRAIGAVFILVAAEVVLMSRWSGDRLLTAGRLVAAGALGWAITTVAILELVDLPVRGELFLAVVGAASLLLGVLELRATRTMRSAIAPGASR